MIDSADELAAGFPEDARRAVLLSRADSRQHRGQRVHRRSTADDLGFRRSARRRTDDDRRTPRICRRRLCRHAGGRRAARGARVETAATRPARLQVVTHARRRQSTPVTQIEKTEQASVKRWDELPQVISVNPIRQLKPGATALLRASTRTARESIALAYQRYGRGKTLAFPVYDSWIWQMDAKIAVEDMTHENVLAPVDAVAGRRRARSGRADQLARSGRAGRRGDADRRGRPTRASSRSTTRGVNAHVTGPNGRGLRRAAAMDRRAQRRISRHVHADRPTACMKRAWTRRAPARRSAPTSAHVRVAPSDSEYFDAAMRAPLLRRISEETGGVLLHAANHLVAPRRREIHGPRRDDRRRARSVGHADRAVPAARRDARLSGATAGCGIWRSWLIAGGTEVRGSESKRICNRTMSRWPTG